MAAARALYSGPTSSAAELAAFGFTPDDYADDEEHVEVFADCWRAVEIFSRLNTQWNYAGMGEPTGLIYASLVSMIELLDVPREERLRLVDDVRVMEREALNVMRARIEERHE